MCSVKNAADRPASSSFNQRVYFCVDADTLADFYFAAGLAAPAAAVGELRGGAVIPGRDHFDVADDDRSALAGEAGWAGRGHLGDADEVGVPAWTGVLWVGQVELAELLEEIVGWGLVVDYALGCH